MKNFIILLAAVSVFGQVPNLEQIPYKGNVSSVQMNRILGSLNDAIGLKVTDVSTTSGDILIRGSSGWLRIVHPGVAANYLCSTGATTAGWCASPIAGVSGLLKGNGNGGAGAAGVSDVTALFQGNGSYLRKDGTTGDPAGTGGGAWGSITGTITNQADLISVLSGKQNTITTGSAAQYIRGDLSLGTLPTIPTIPTIGNGPLKGVGGNAVAMTASDVAGLWTGVGAYMRADGTLGDPGGGTGSSPGGAVGSIQKNAGGGAFDAAVAGTDYVAPNDSRLTNSRTPTAHAASHASGQSDALTPAAIGAVATSDSRLTDARVPTAHAASHAAGQTDALTLGEAQVTGLVTDLAARVPTTRTINSKALSADISIVKGDVGLGNVDNTSDLNKPISTLTQAALNAKQNTITTGTTAQYIRGDLSLAAFPTVPTIGTGPLKGSGGNAVAATAADIVALWTTCTGFLKNDGTCAVSPMQYPAAGLANSTGGGWGTPYSVSTTIGATPSATAIPTEAAVAAAIKSPPSLDVGSTSAVPAYVAFYPPNEGTNYLSVVAPDTRTARGCIKLPPADPSAGQALIVSSVTAGGTCTEADASGNPTTVAGTAIQLGYGSASSGILASAYGVACDSTTQNATPLQNAITAACTAGKTLYIENGAGVCYFNTGVTIACDKLIVQGVGKPTLSYTGTATAIAVGNSSRVTSQVQLKDFALDLTNAGSAAVGIKSVSTRNNGFYNIEVMTGQGGANPNGQTAMVFDGTGSFSAMNDLYSPYIHGDFTTGVLVTGANSTNSANSTYISGGGIFNTSVSKTGSIGLRVQYGDTTRVSQTSVENWGTGVQIESNFNGPIGARFEGNTLDWKTTAGVQYTSFLGAVFNNFIDLGTLTSYSTSGSLNTSSFSGLRIENVAYANLGTVPLAGISKYCTNCTAAPTCAAGGTGHMAVSNGTAWTCGTAASLAVGQTTGTLAAGDDNRFVAVGATPMSTVTAATLAQLPASSKIRTCEIAIGDPGAASPVLADDNDSPAVCGNLSGATLSITEVKCAAYPSNTGSPAVLPIITGGAANSILSAAIACGNATFGSAGSLQGSPTQTDGQSIDGNISTAGGTAKYIVIRIKRTL